MNKDEFFSSGKKDKMRKNLEKGARKENIINANEVEVCKGEYQDRLSIIKFRQKSFSVEKTCSLHARG